MKPQTNRLTPKWEVWMLERSSLIVWLLVMYIIIRKSILWHTTKYIFFLEQNWKLEITLRLQKVDGNLDSRGGSCRQTRKIGQGTHVDALGNQVLKFQNQNTEQPYPYIIPNTTHQMYIYNTMLKVTQPTLSPKNIQSSRIFLIELLKHFNADMQYRMQPRL